MNKYTLPAVIAILLVLGAVYYTKAPVGPIETIENQFTSTTTPTTPTSTSNTPATTTTATPDTSSNATTITQADNGKTIHVKQGTHVVLSLGELTWSLNFTPLGIINRIKNIAVLRGSQGVYTADTIGTTVLQAEGRPICNPGELCAQYIVNVTTTIVVQK